MGILLFIRPCVCPFFFLSKFFVKDISTTVQDRYFIFGIQVHNDKLYRGIANGHSPICSSFCLFLFLSFQIFVKDISTTIKDRNFIFGIQVHNHKSYRGIENGPSPTCSSFYLFLFFFFPDFLSKISPQPFKTEASNLVYRFTTTNCIVGLKMGLLLFVLPYVFFLSLQIFRQRYLHNHLK